MVDVSKISLGDKVICVDAIDTDGLTHNKQYEVLGAARPHFPIPEGWGTGWEGPAVLIYVQNDFGNEVAYFPWRFKRVEEANKIQNLAVEFCNAKKKLKDAYIEYMLAEERLRNEKQSN